MEASRPHRPGVEVPFRDRTRSRCARSDRAALREALSKFGTVPGISLAQRAVGEQSRFFRYRVNYKEGRLFVMCSIDKNGKIQGFWHELDTDSDRL